MFWCHYQSFNQSLTIHDKAQTEMIKTGLKQIKGLLREVKGKHSEMVKLPLEVNEKDDKMFEMQNQALGRRSILQTHANAFIVRNFELHEYPIIQLFVILPVDAAKWDPRQLLRNKFRLRFLCECGDHTAKTSKGIQNQIHVAIHDGYEIQSNTESFHPRRSKLIGL
ncbi:hypothetical protein BCR41DRAFT_399288 [Lobosporangium transversale]|uniref:Uncharacterized protein n=1 Tax=Lobosporangium transversale TaxID=64571 RepID=A0A1Y2GE18_9FUNG|nr:hypothetical protein BCR41DRAFT_399288 [Lobosporangium transversale]ORZ08240.1 hypothetical protein BCR41DRAFT_399288 [Lobosporangium transversale]|eukprot:XP_021878323.1 hypothetical protein BCR41DRAFT_399288 [Lobosporangium transversale]